MATFRERGSSIQAGVCVDGVRKSATFDTKEEAQKWARKMESSLDSGTHIDLREVAQTTLKVPIQRFEVVSPFEIANLRRNWRSCLPRLSGLPRRRRRSADG